MAVVRITGDLHDSVASAVGEQFDAAQEAAEALRPEVGMDVYNIVLKNFLAETARIDPTYFQKVDRLTIRVRDTVTGDVYETWTLDGELIVPYDLPESEGKWDMGSYGHVTVDINNDPQFHGIYDQINEWQNALLKVKQERNAAQAAVKKVLDSFTTLAPALKAWPALWDLLPEYVKDKHREIVERTKATPVKIDVNETHLEKLTSKLVMGRIK
jgi:hypothetical protein